MHSTPNPFALTPEFEPILRRMFEDQEGRIPWMYPDSEGNVTAGIGHLLPDALSAFALPFIFRESGIPATTNQIVDAWNYVKAAGKPYRFLILREPDIDALWLKDCQRFLPVLRRAFPIASVPTSAKLGLWDMVFNLGSFRAFPELTKAVLAGDWNRVAQESKRRKIGERRNIATRLLFEAAAHQAPLEQVQQA